MDPLSITAAVVGLTHAIPSIVAVISDFVRRAEQAPDQARTVVAELNNVLNFVSQLQVFLFRKSSKDLAHTACIQIDQVLTTLTGCIITVSELEETVSGVQIFGPGLLERVIWSRKESKIARIVQQLQNHKLSLSCMLAIMNSNTVENVEDSVSQLSTSISELLASNQDLARRMQRLEGTEATLRDPYRHSVDSAKPRSTVGGFSPVSHSDFRVPSLAFEWELKLSRVYRKISFSKSTASLSTINTRSKTWSCLSGLSMADISHISVLSIPISPGELFNGQLYDLETARTQSDVGPAVPPEAVSDSVPPAPHRALSATSSDDNCWRQGASPAGVLSTRSSSNLISTRLWSEDHVTQVAYPQGAALATPTPDPPVLPVPPFPTRDLPAEQLDTDDRHDTHFSESHLVDETAVDDDLSKAFHSLEQQPMSEIEQQLMNDFQQRLTEWRDRENKQNQADWQLHYL